MMNIRWTTWGDAVPAARAIREDLASRMCRSHWYRREPYAREGVTVDLRRCIYTMRSSLGASQRECWLRDEMGSILGMAGYQQLARGISEELSSYCGLLLADGTTFEIISHGDDSESYVASRNGELLCRATKQAAAEQGTSMAARLKQAIVPRVVWQVDGPLAPLGHIDFQYGTNRRSLVFETTSGPWNIQIRKPAWRENRQDFVIPDTNPADLDPSFCETLFAVNLMFRICVFSLDWTVG